MSKTFLSAPLTSNNLIPFVERISSLDFTAKCKAVNPFESYALISASQANM